MPVPKFKYENLHWFIFGSLIWLALAYAAIEIVIHAMTYLLSLFI